MRRLIALDAELDRFRDRSVQVLGITADDDPISLGQWGHKIGVRFDLVADVGGSISKQFGFFSGGQKVTDKAVAVVNRGRIVLREKVTGTEVPESVFAALATII
jgi:peroxiredoxin